MIKYLDVDNKFYEWFDPSNGFYLRSSIISKDKNFSGKEPFMRSFPNLLDVGIMEHCVCANKCKIDCYQNAIHRCGENMSLEDYKSIIEQSKGKVFQIALGGSGDPDTHENFEEILKVTRDANIVPNFTTSGICMTPDKAALCNEYCGAVAVSDHNTEYTANAVSMLLDAGVKTNVHFVLSNKTIRRAINLLADHTFEANGRKSNINAIVFLLYKPIGLGKQENVLQADNPLLDDFFDIIDTYDLPYKVGFDSCSCAGIINHSQKVDLTSVDFCEGGRFSMYIDSKMNAMPCSFANQNPEWFVNLRDYTIKEAWDSEIFDKFRNSLRYSCPNCECREFCGGGCPLCNEITLCNLGERSFMSERKYDG